MAADLQEQAVQVEWKAAKITAAALKGLIEQILANREKITHGEQSLKKLNLQGKKLESIELTGEDMQAFKRELNKYAVDFSIKKDTETQNYTVFFKGQDVDRVYTDNTITDRVISSERNPDVSEYARELDAYVKDMIVGTWKGTFDEWPTADSIYWSYTFSADGTYSFTNGTTTEAGTYTITSDPNNNYYHSSMQLTFDGGERTMQFYFTTTNPVKMITDDQTDPTYLKSLV